MQPTLIILVPSLQADDSGDVGRQFQQVIEDSLERSDWERALELSAEWLAHAHTSAEQNCTLRLWRAELMSQLGRWDQVGLELDRLLCRRSLASDCGVLIPALILSAGAAAHYGETSAARESLDAAESLGLGGWLGRWRLEQARWLARTRELDAALELLTREDSDEHHIERGRLLFRAGRLDEAEAALRPIAERAETARTVAEARRLLGLLLLERGELRAALAQLSEALQAFQSLALWVGVAKTLSSLGQACSELGELPEALYFTSRAERVTRRLGAEAELAVVYGRLGALCVRLKDLARATRFHELDVELCHRLGNPRALAYAQMHLALSQRAQGNLGQACALLEEAAERFALLGEHHALQRSRVELGRTLIERNLLREAGAQLNLAGELATRGQRRPDPELPLLQARLLRLSRQLSAAEKALVPVFQGLEEAPQRHPLRAEAWREQGYLCLLQGRPEEAAGAFSSALRAARRTDSLWAECLDQLDRLNDLHAARIILSDLCRPGA